MNKTIKLYHHKTDGGAEYLFDTFVAWEHQGKNGNEGVLKSDTQYMIRIDGDIKKDAEMTIVDLNKSIQLERKEDKNYIVEILEFHLKNVNEELKDLRGQQPDDDDEDLNRLLLEEEQLKRILKNFNN